MTMVHKYSLKIDQPSRHKNFVAQNSHIVMGHTKDLYFMVQVGWHGRKSGPCTIGLTFSVGHLQLQSFGQWSRKSARAGVTNSATQRLRGKMNPINSNKSETFDRRLIAILLSGSRLAILIQFNFTEKQKAISLKANFNWIRMERLNYGILAMLRSRAKLSLSTTVDRLNLGHKKVVLKAENYW